MRPGEELPQEVWKEIIDKFVHGDSPAKIAKWVMSNRLYAISRARIQHRLTKQLRLKKGSANPKYSESTRPVLIPDENDLIVLLDLAIANFKTTPTDEAIMQLQRLWRLTKLVSMSPSRLRIQLTLPRLQNDVLPPEPEGEGEVDFGSTTAL